MEIVDKTYSWYHCFCGTLFHDGDMDQSIFNDEYIKKYKEVKNLENTMNYFFKTYGGIIEELTYGRKFLDVGYAVPHRINYLQDRGWVGLGIDIANPDMIKADFEDYDFGEEKFDLINIGHCIESMQYPLKNIKKCYDLLNQKGILTITTPAPELINLLGLDKFSHCFVAASQWIFIPKNKIIEHANKLGFKEVLSRYNLSDRFGICNDSHIILQKRK